MWVYDYIKAQHPENEANKILDDIDEWYICSTEVKNTIYIYNFIALHLSHHLQGYVNFLKAGALNSRLVMT
jgi:hypothetical protein